MPTAGRSGESSESMEQLATRIAGDSAPTPNCRPWDYRDFMSRVSTYTASSWFAKPNEVSPLVCASHGWISKSRDVLECLGCQEALSYGNGKGFIDRLQNGHGKFCPWQGNSCPSSFTRFPTMLPDELLEGVKTRAKCLLRLLKGPGPFPKVDIPELFLEAYEGGLAKLTHAARKLLPASECEGVTDEVLGTVVAAAIAGWGASQNNPSKGACLHCTICNRMAGVWNFASLAPSAGQVAEVEVRQAEKEAPKAKRRKVNAFMILKEHRSFCPWVTVNAVPGEAEVVSRPGWDLTLRVVLQEGQEEEEGASGGKAADVFQAARKMLEAVFK
ncbi:unnamed protein product [Chrysoparadoxa australica]